MSAPSDSPESSSLESTASPDLSEPTDALEDTPSEPSDAPDDPRMNGEYIRTVSHPEGDVTLVGVVHDHPASAYRARAVVRERDPETVALEVPPLALALYREYARGARSPPSFGGEMSAAALAARERDADLVGIDAPTPEFCARLARNCWDERADVETVRRLASGLASVTRHAAICRIAATVAARTSLRVEVDAPVEHDCTRADPPNEQARDEREQAERSRSFARAFDPPTSVRLRDETREECMAENLRSLRAAGDAVAIVGLDHLDAVAERIER
ncbi:hypothetical protein NGM10_09870 [Halorussus salilacus]|uniref:hypothetical protein n=1 Tax=Halorussus salilacus TaxID=2953750 RepID=UPI00209E32D5|nr:hypothetical protein [Halorussus salilacus]USZ67036.1 hypothetical protein NGM10_09870 [Halorussus salilacus]